MLLYLKIAKFSFNVFFTYPIELIANFLKRILSTIFVVVLWIIAYNSGAQVDIKMLIPYYFIASGVAEITMSQYGQFGRNLGKLIKSGNISNILIKPVNSILFIFSSAIGESGTRLIFGILMVIIGMLIDSSMTLSKVILFIVFLILSISVSFAFNMFEGIIFFYVPEAGGFRSTINHLKNILGGLMVPLYVFPVAIKNIIEFLPFASMVYYPAHVQNINSDEIIKFILVGIFWSVVLNFIAIKWWNKALKNYDAVGI